MLILGLLGMYFDAAVVFVTNSSLFFRLAVAILCMVQLRSWMILAEACRGTFVVLKGACGRTTTTCGALSKNGRNFVNHNFSFWRFLILSIPSKYKLIDFFLSGVCLEWHIFWLHLSQCKMWDHLCFLVANISLHY